ncbi:MAG: hypothetical protein ACRDJW_18780 [Thermomicrobiales bacterium]
MAASRGPGRISRRLFVKLAGSVMAAAGLGVARPRETVARPRKPAAWMLVGSRPRRWLLQPGWFLAKTDSFPDPEFVPTAFAMTPAEAVASGEPNLFARD